MTGRTGHFGAGHAGLLDSYCPTFVRASIFGACIGVVFGGGDLFSSHAHAGEDGAPPAQRYETEVVAEPRMAEARADDVAASSVVTKDRTPRSAESVAELVSELPGVQVTRLGGLGANATLSIRGSTADQVAVYVDGIPLNPAVGGGVDLSLVPFDEQGRIEIYRGQSPMQFGASAMGGVLSLESRVPDAPAAALALGGGSFSTAHGSARLGGRAGRLGGLIVVRGLRSDGDFSYRSDSGTAFDPADDAWRRRTNNQLRQEDGMARGELAFQDGRRVSVSLWLLDRAQGLPGDGLRPAQSAALSLWRAMAAVRYDGRGDLGPGGKLSAQLYSVAEEQRLDDALGEVGLGQRRTRDRTLRLGLLTNGARTLSDSLRLQGVIDLRAESFSPRNELNGALNGPPAERAFAALGGEVSYWPLPALRVMPSVRVELAHDASLTRSTSGAYSDTTHPEARALPIARFALLLAGTSWLDVRGNLGRYARMPSLRERYGNTGLYLGNPTLRPETGLNADLGLVVRAPRLGLYVDAGVFAAWADDLIALEQGAYQVRSANVDRAFVRGVETSLSAAPWRHLRVVGQFTYSDARNDSDIAARKGRQLPLRPRARGYVRPELTTLVLGEGRGAIRLGAYADLDYTAGNYLDPANLVSVPPRVLYGGGLHVELPRLGCRLVASARNLGAAQVFDLAGYPLPGRSFWLDMIWSSTWLSQPKGEHDT